MSEATASAITAVVAVAIFLRGISIYNRLAYLSKMKDEAWIGLDVQLKRRLSLIPNLVETVKGCAKHERETLERVTAARGTVSDAATQKARIEAENALSGTLEKLFAVSEAYPDLKANANFLELQRKLYSIENEIHMAQHYYNSSAREYNIWIQSFPAVLISRNLGYREAAIFEAGETQNPEAPPQTQQESQPS
ncbi:MAG: LemA family protein [Synergistaceae bacterium]|jgi:LemA protein|nr:LemA family protein [Synergistaceae bacterium]